MLKLTCFCLPVVCSAGLSSRLSCGLERSIEQGLQVRWTFANQASEWPRRPAEESRGKRSGAVVLRGRYKAEHRTANMTTLIDLHVMPDFRVHLMPSPRLTRSPKSTSSHPSSLSLLHDN